MNIYLVLMLCTVNVLIGAAADAGGQLDIERCLLIRPGRDAEVLPHRLALVQRNNDAQARVLALLLADADMGRFGEGIEATWMGRIIPAVDEGSLLGQALQSARTEAELPALSALFEITEQTSTVYLPEGNPFTISHDANQLFCFDEQGNFLNRQFCMEQGIERIRNDAETLAGYEQFLEEHRARIKIGADADEIEDLFAVRARTGCCLLAPCACLFTSVVLSCGWLMQ